MMMNYRLFPRITSIACMTLAVIVLASSLSSCGRFKKTAPAYGPGSEWVDDMRDRIRKSVDDPDKVTELVVVVNKIEMTLIDLDKEVRDYYDTLGELDRNYQTTREEFEDAMDQFNAKRDSYFEKMLSYIFEMKKIAGREDWGKISDIDKTLYEDWQRPLGSSSSGGL